MQGERQVELLAHLERETEKREQDTKNRQRNKGKHKAGGGPPVERCAGEKGDPRPGRHADCQWLVLSP